MIRAMHLSQDSRLRAGLEPMDIAFALQQPGELVWVDIEKSTPEESETLLTETFQFHPLAVQNAFREALLPKVDDWGRYLHLVLHAANIAGENADAGQLQIHELDIFLGKNFIVTYHANPIEAVQKTWEVVERDERHLQGGADHVLYRLADEIATGLLQAAETIDARVDQLEGDIFRDPRPEALEKIVALKRSVVRLRRTVAPQQEVFSRLGRDEYEMIDAKDRVYFRDVHDHLARLYQTVEGVRDLVTGALDTYMSMSNYRLTEIMRTLTVITTIFMPLTFVTSFFGMNFFFPENPVTALMEIPVLIFVVALLIFIPAGMLIWMRRRHWIKV